jgi:hypothetical protein
MTSHSAIQQKSLPISDIVFCQKYSEIISLATLSVYEPMDEKI